MKRKFEGSGPIANNKHPARREHLPLLEALLEDIGVLPVRAAQQFPSHQPMGKPGED